jgi:predicted small secreted protein
MKFVVMIVLGLSLVGCGTVGGAVNGAGQDLQKVGEWIQSK